jgi:hypothetical protein
LIVDCVTIPEFPPVEDRIPSDRQSLRVFLNDLNNCLIMLLRDDALHRPIRDRVVLRHLVDVRDVAQPNLLC